MNDEFDKTTEISLDEILSDIDNLRKNREEISSEEFVSPVEVSRASRRKAQETEEVKQEDKPAEERSESDTLDSLAEALEIDGLFEEEKKPEKAAGDTQVIEVPDDPKGHELFISMGDKGSSVAEKKEFITEEYEPEEYGLSDDRSLSFISRGVREVRKARETGDKKETSSEGENEYVSPSQRNDIALKLRSRLRADILRGIFTGICAVGLLYLGLYNVASLPLIPFLATPLYFNLTALGLLLAVIGINCLPLAFAIRDIFTAKANADALLPFAGLASVTLVVYDMIAPSETLFPLYGASFALACTLSAIFRGVRTSAVFRSFMIIGSNRQKGVLVPIEDEHLNRDIMGSMICDGVTVFKPERTDFVSDFMKNSFSPDVSSHTALILTYVSIPLAALIAGLSVWLGSSVRETFNAACCILFAFLPLTLQLVFALPFARMSKKASLCSSAVIGYRAAEEMNGVGAVVIDSNHLFPKGSISLDAMRTFGTLRIDDAIADAASVVCAAGGALSRIFLGVIDNDRSLLRKVDSLLYEDGLGLSAWVNEKRVLVGTAELLRGHGVTVPSRDYEARYAGSGQNLVYVSVGGVLTAMFVVSYHPRQEIYDILFELRKQQIGLVIVNRDCNITSEMITKLFDFPSKLINIMTPSNEHLLGESMEKSCPAGIVYSKGLIGIGRTVISSLRLVAGVSLANAVQIGGILLTTVLTVYLAAVGSISQFTLAELLVCQVLWGILTLLSAVLRKS